MVEDISDQFVHLMGECSKIIVISKNTDASNMEKSVLFHATKDGFLPGMRFSQENFEPPSAPGPNFSRFLENMTIALKSFYPSDFGSPASLTSLFRP